MLRRLRPAVGSDPSDAHRSLLERLRWLGRDPGVDGNAQVAPTSFVDRARRRRRLRYLRRTRELALRDLGGFVLNSRRLHRPREDIVDAKVSGLLALDSEIAALGAKLDDE